MRRTASFLVFVAAGGCAVGFGLARLDAKKVRRAQAPAEACELHRASAVATDLRSAWETALDGKRPSDPELQSYSDAIDILECVATEQKEERNR